MRSASAILSLVRWPNALLAAAGVLVGAWWAGGDVVAAPVVFAAVAAVGIAIFANADNDVHDVEIDRIAHPERALPSGRLSPPAARRTAVGGALLALASALASGTVVALATIAVIVTIAGYTRVLKRRGLSGNVTAAIVASLPFAYGGWAAGDVRASVALVLVAIPLHLAREVAKDLDDAPADASLRRTLPLVAGPRAARVVILLAVGAFVVALSALAIRRPIFALLAVPALALSILAARRVVDGRRGGPALFKTAMVCALTALVAAYRG